MKYFYLIIGFFCCFQINLLADMPPLDGEYQSNTEKTISWMIENNHPMANMEKKKMRKALSEPFLLIHKWEDGNLTVVAANDWKVESTREWTMVESNIFKSSIPADENNTTMIYTIKILSEDEYYLEVLVNGQRSREYFNKIRRR